MTPSVAASGSPPTPGATQPSAEPSTPSPTARATTLPTAAPTPRPTVTHPPATRPPATPVPVTPTPATGEQAIRISDFAFTPLTITVAVGTLVTWTNRQPDIQHTVTADDGSFRSDPLSTGSSFSHVFTIVGTYSYHCSIHPDMTGTVVATG